jgi:hypothetical protein
MSKQDEIRSAVLTLQKLLTKNGGSGYSRGYMAQMVTELIMRLPERERKAEINFIMNIIEREQTLKDVA